MRKTGIVAVVGALAVVAAAIGVSCVASPPPDDTPITTSASACPANAETANLNFTLKDLDGKGVKLSDYKGKVLLLDFWATWCAPCKVEVPWFIELYDKYKSRGFEVVGVVVLDQFANAGPFARQFKMNYTVLDGDGREDLDDAYGPLFALPTTFIIGRDGRICDKHIGLTAREKFEAAIKSLL